MVKSQEQWVSIEPIFMRLYHEENKSLHAVRHELAAKHGFQTSKSALTKQIRKWKAFKNYKASEKQDLISQRISGKQPQLDPRGRAIKWDRVYRATRGQVIHNRHRNSDLHASELDQCKEALDPFARLFPQPIDQDSCLLGLVAAIWYQSTVQFASQNPTAPSYNVEYSLYRQSIQSLTIITARPSRLEWPRREIESLCNAIPALVRTQPAIACDLLTLLVSESPSCSFELHEKLKDQLFTYIRNAAMLLLPQTNHFRRFISNLHNRESLARLGAPILKTKLETMWNTGKSYDATLYHQRPFFRQVLLGAVLGVIEFEELEFASMFLQTLSNQSIQEPLYLVACTRLLEKQER